MARLMGSPAQSRHLDLGGARVYGAVHRAVRAWRSIGGYCRSGSHALACRQQRLSLPKPILHHRLSQQERRAPDMQCIHAI